MTDRTEMPLPLFTSGTGSGKRSGSGPLENAFLGPGVGGLVAVVKTEDVALWRRYAKESGRGESLLTLDENDNVESVR